MPRGVFLALRYSSLGFFFLTSIYCLMAYTPLTFTHVIQAGLLPWLSPFAKMHRWLFWAAEAAVFATLVTDLSRPSKRAFALVYAVAAAAAGVALAIHPVLPTLGNDVRSFIWSEIALLPPLALAIADHFAVRGEISWTSTSTREDASVLAASASCLFAAFVTYSTTFEFRAAAGLRLSSEEAAIGLLWSFLLHASFVGTAFIVWGLARALAAWTLGPRAPAEYAFIAFLVATLFALLARNVAFSAMSLHGPGATTAAATWAIVLIASLSGAALRLEAFTGQPVSSGLRLLMSPLSMPRASLVVRCAWVVVVLALAVRLQVVSSRMDWNGLMQKLCACFSWAMLFAASLAIFRPLPEARGGRTILLMGLASVGTLTYGCWRTFGRSADSAPILDKLAAAEPSFGFLYELAGSGGKRETMGELFEFMQRSTNFPHDRHIEPLDVQFSEIGSAPGPKPHVFMVVIDSLRRDYVAPFNPAVTFTPSLEKFARGSDAFVNAFTHYGATGLSEPSIWVGGMMPHQQYIAPFAPMNALEKVLLGENYVRLISVDSILGQILDQSASLVPMDVNTVTGDYDLCGSLDELRGKMEVRRNQVLRFFAYTQSQNVHVSRITREGATVPPGVHYPGFYDPYASRLNRIDACFGRFIEYLQAAGLYDDSIVVVTADHGDMLGEEGRWGHAYYLNPEVIRIPLIIHRPERLRGLSVDASSLAFSTDIAPSIYRLLGYTPATLGAGFGRSLYGPRTPDREWHMLVSSYGPVYGILEDESRHLYVADAVNYNDAYFDVAAGTSAQRDPVSEEVRSRNVRRIMEGVKELHAVFHVE